MKEEDIKDKILNKLTEIPLEAILIIAVCGLLIYETYLLYKDNILSLSNLCRFISN